MRSINSRAAIVATPLAVASPSLVGASRNIQFLYTSYYSRYQFPNMQVQPKYNVKRDSFRRNIKSSYRKAATEAATDDAAGLMEQQQRVVEWPWYGGADPSSSAAAPQEDIAAANHQTTTTTAASNNGKSQQRGILAQPNRPYVPLADVFHIELRGDNLISGGLFQDALQHYGVCAKARQAAYPDPAHTENIKILIKLARAFRLAGKPESAIANLERCLELVEQNGARDGGDANATPVSSSRGGTVTAEHVCEIFLELGLAKRDVGSDEAGTLFEDSARLMEEFHDLGGSHRGLRLLSRIAKRFNRNFHSKFVYYSPHDYDRTYAVVDTALSEAEKWYAKRDDADGTTRVLETRLRMMDKKNFNMVYLTGRIRNWRGRNMLKRKWNTSAPSATEVLALSPTLHQVYHDFSRTDIAPLGREEEVQLPPGARLLDDGDPLRHLRERSRARRQRQEASVAYVRDRDRSSAEEHKYDRRRQDPSA